MSNELPRPIGYATHRGMQSLQKDDSTVFLYPNDYLIRPDQVQLFTADQMHEYGRARERAAYERVEALCREIALDLRGVHASAYDWQADGAEKCADEIANLSRALGADK